MALVLMGSLVSPNLCLSHLCRAGPGLPAEQPEALCSSGSCRATWVPQAPPLGASADAFSPHKRKLHHACAPKPQLPSRLRLFLPWQPAVGFLPCSVAGEMASLWHLLLVVLSSLLLVAGSKLPALSALFQDGAPEANVEAHDLRGRPGSPQGAPGRWEWQTGEDVSRELPQRPRRRRAAVTVSTQAHNHTGPGLVGTSAGAPTAIHASERNLTGTSRGVVATRVNPTKSSPAMPADLSSISTTDSSRSTPTSTVDYFDDYTTEGAPSTGTALSQNASVDGTGGTTVALQRTTEVSNVTIGKGPPVDVARPSTSSQTLVGTSDASTGTRRPPTVTPGPSFRAKGTVTAKAASSTSSSTPAKPPSQSSPPVPPSLVGQCLLAIFLLALVAGLFIVLSTVLAIVLWRQRRAYKLNRNSHTEMVCISSLLAHDEAEEAGERHPRVRRMRMLGENGSEAEMDNLTLNSFLPDH